MLQPANAEASFVMRYERAHGIHHFELEDGMPVTALSFNQWRDFDRALDELAETEGYIVSPELMTSPKELSEVCEYPGRIAERVRSVKERSFNHPRGAVILGTAAVGFARHNTLQMFREGAVIGQAIKRYLTPIEQDVFAQSVASPRQTLVIPSHQVAICAELFDIAFPRQEAANRIIQPQHRSLIVSSCWGVPMPHHADFYANYPHMTPEINYRNQLEKLISRILGNNPNLQEVVMVDRAVPDHGVEPFNAHFLRSS